MKKILLVAAAAAGLASIAPAFAADGTITVTGSVSTTTCKVANNGAVAVVLPTVATTALSAAAAVAGYQPFSINLTGCGANTRVTTYFEPGATIAANGNLVNAGTATNVQVRLFNDDRSVINLAGAPTAQNSKQFTIDTAGSLNYYAAYYATAPATAGTVSTSVIYSVTYL